MKFIYENNYLDDFRLRIEEMLKMSEKCGWGFPDILHDIYDEYNDIEELL